MTYDSEYLSGPIYYAGKGAAQEWCYDTTDLVATVIGSGHISDADVRGLQIGDLITIRKFDSLSLRTNPGISLHQVTAISASGGATLSAAYGSSSGLTVPVVSSNSTPAVTDDIGDGYAVGSIWVELDVDDAYILTDNATGAGLWKPIVDRFMISGQLNLNSAITTMAFLTSVGFPVPVAAKLISAYTVTKNATLTAAATTTVTLSRNATAITNGAITINAAATIGDIDLATPSALNTFAAGDSLNLAIATTNAAATNAGFVAYFERLVS